MTLLFVMLGGFLGSISRYALGEWIHTDNGFPLGTLLINLIGCLCLGWYLTFVSQSKKINSEMTSMIGTGFIGSFTTFSTFSVETIQLVQNGFVFLAVMYVFSSIIFGLLLAYIGYKMALVYQKEGDAV
jgi:fluoride exporter